MSCVAPARLRDTAHVLCQLICAKSRYNHAIEHAISGAIVVQSKCEIAIKEVRNYAY